MEITLTLTSDFPYWVKETTHAFRKTAEVGGGQNLDMKFDYPFDYFSGMGNKQMNNTAFAETNFRMVIYGQCVDPAVYVNGHLYQVSCELAAGEYLTIDSVSKKIFKTAVDGAITNLFSKRNRESYIFEPIQPGENSVIWEGEYGLDIILLEDRSEPRWT